MTALNSRLKAWRESKRLTQDHAAALLGFPVRTYQKYELGSSAPGAGAMEAFVTAGGINANWLLTGEGPMLLGDLQAAGWSGALDRERMAMAVEALEEVLIEANRTMAPAKKAQVLLAAYDLLEEPSATRAKVVQLLKFAA